LAELPDLDPLVHAPVRLAVLSLLATLDEVEFTHLRDRLGATDGNLSVHLAKLEDAGYLAVTKGFAGKKPRTTYRLTEKGRAAFLRYVKQLKALLASQL
jgi:DNA-binding MarR family transcriptional regulator